MQINFPPFPAEGHLAFYWPSPHATFVSQSPNSFTQICTFIHETKTSLVDRTNKDPYDPP